MEDDEAWKNWEKKDYWKTDPTMTAAVVEYGIGPGRICCASRISSWQELATLPSVALDIVRKASEKALDDMCANVDENETAKKSQ